MHCSPIGLHAILGAGLALLLALAPACQTDPAARRGASQRPVQAGDATQARPAHRHPTPSPGAHPTAHRHHGPAHHRFRDAARWARVFENPARDKWQRPEAVLRVLGLRPTDRIADIGAATGYFPVRFARAVPKGKVYAFDIEPDMVRYLADRARKAGLGNLVALRARPDGISPPEPLDWVFLCNTYHHLRDRAAYFRRLARHLRPGGRVAVVDFKQGQLPVGPPPAHRVKLSTVAAELTQAGFRKVVHDETTLPYQFIAIYQLASQ